MSEILLVEMDFNNKTWYLSEEGYYSDHYYAPYLEDSPSLEIGQVKGGYIGIRIGDISIANRPNERFSPFSIYGGGYDVLIRNPNQKIPIRISWRKVNDSDLIFEGLMYLKTFDVDKFEFILEDSYSDKDLLTTASDITSELFEIDTVSIKGFLTYAVITSPEHGLVTGDKISVNNAINTEFNTPFQGSIPQKVNITKIDENSFSYGITQPTSAYEPSGTYIVRTLTKKNNPFSFGVVKIEKGLIQTDDGTSGTKRGYAYANPQLDINNPDYPVLLYDDGVLHGTQENITNNGIYRTVNISSVTYDIDIVTVTTSTNHNMVPGNSIAIFNLTPSILNSEKTGDVAIDTPTANTFTYYRNGINEEPSAQSGGYLWVFGEYYGAARLPTADTIFSRAARNDLTVGQSGNYPDDPNFSGTPTVVNADDGLTLVGTALVSGISTNGSTLADFFSYLRSELGISSVDFSKAPNASNLNLELWETSQTKLIDFAGEVSYAANHLFEIRNDQIIVIDRSIIPDNYHVIENYSVIKTKYTMPNPVKAIIAKWKINKVNAAVKPAQLSEYDESVMISNSDSGEIREVYNITKNIEDQRSMLFKIRDIINKIVISISIGGIRSDLKIGDRVKINRDEDGLSMDFIIRTISFDFSDLTTEIVGDGIIFVIEQDAVY